MEAILFHVPDMSCDHCERAVRSELAAVPGVEAVEVDLDRKTVTVRGSADVEAVRAAIAAAGYEAA